MVWCNCITACRTALDETPRPRQLTVLSKIVLIRHGRSALGAEADWLSQDGVLRRRAAYDRAGIAPEDSPPVAALAAVAQCEIVVSSDLARAIESAERLAPGRLIAQSPLLREAPLPVPPFPLRLPLPAWDALMTVAWGYRMLQRREAAPAETARAAEAAQWLETVAQQANTIAVVTHVVFRRLLANQLAAVGWKLPTRGRSYKWWSVWTAERP
jgi:broad specificity phosphatase PhoE